MEEKNVSMSDMVSDLYQSPSKKQDAPKKDVHSVQKGKSKK